MSEPVPAAAALIGTAIAGGRVVGVVAGDVVVLAGGAIVVVVVVDGSGASVVVVVGVVVVDVGVAVGSGASVVVVGGSVGGVVARTVSFSNKGRAATATAEIADSARLQAEKRFMWWWFLVA